MYVRKAAALLNISRAALVDLIRIQGVHKDWNCGILGASGEIKIKIYV